MGSTARYSSFQWWTETGQGSPGPLQPRLDLPVKTGRTLQELAAELERQRTSRADYLAPQGAVAAKVVEGELVLDGLNGDAKNITPHAHRQLATQLEIPQKYYDRMAAERPELLAANVNTWLQKDKAEKRMFRTLDHKVRAIMSPRYRALDNFELAESLLPVLLDNKVQIASAELTETRMYIKGILPELSDKLPEGMTYGQGHNSVAYGSDQGRGKVVAAIVISNSEVGNGSLRIEPSVFTTFCTNLMILKQAAMRKYHVGRANSADEDFSIYRDETREADDRAFFLKVRDIAQRAFDPKVFAEAVAQIRAAGQQPITSDDLPTVVEVAIRQLALPERTSGGILTALARGGDLSQWGLSSAITEVAGTVEDYELATTMERAGGEVLALAPRQWATIAEAKAA